MFSLINLNWRFIDKIKYSIFKKLKKVYTKLLSIFMFSIPSNIRLILIHNEPVRRNKSAIR